MKKGNYASLFGRREKILKSDKARFDGLEAGESPVLAGWGAWSNRCSQ